MTKMPGEHKYKRKIWASLSCLGILGFAYLGLFSMTIKNIAEYQSSQKRTSSLTADISKIEFTFLEKEAGISPSLALEYGFIEPDNIVIARKSSESSAVALVGRIK